MCASNPFRVMVAIIIAVLVASAPLMKSSVDGSPAEAHVWCANNSQEQPDWFHQLFQLLTERVAFQIPATRMLQLIFPAPRDASSRNILRREFIKAVAFDLPRFILNSFTHLRAINTFETTISGFPIRYDSFCKRISDPGRPLISIRNGCQADAPSSPWHTSGTTTSINFSQTRTPVPIYSSFDPSGMLCRSFFIALFPHIVLT